MSEWSSARVRLPSNGRQQEARVRKEAVAEMEAGADKAGHRDPGSPGERERTRADKAKGGRKGELVLTLVRVRLNV